MNKATIENILAMVMDPEVPVLSVLDLGVVRDIILKGDVVEIVITPTYSGCPAMDVISMSIKMALLENGIKNSKITMTLSPAWTTDWMSEAGKQKLKEYGIAPPGRKAIDSIDTFDEEKVACPQCQSYNTILISQFGSTACKALYRCLDCKEPFDHFKCH
jgi:ring-1,2-phenylacetyl-CoA epoxidase subunit PaaD